MAARGGPRNTAKRRVGQCLPFHEYSARYGSVTRGGVSNEATGWGRRAECYLVTERSELLTRPSESTAIMGYELAVADAFQFVWDGAGGLVGCVCVCVCVRVCGGGGKLNQLSMSLCLPVGIVRSAPSSLLF